MTKTALLNGYRELEERMKALADAEHEVFLPNPPPEGAVDYVLICMEPSLRRWASSADQATSTSQSRVSKLSAF